MCRLLIYIVTNRKLVSNRFRNKLVLEYLPNTYRKEKKPTLECVPKKKLLRGESSLGENLPEARKNLFAGKMYT